MAGQKAKFRSEDITDDFIVKGVNDVTSTPTQVNSTTVGGKERLCVETIITPPGQGGNPVSIADGFQKDPFGRLRVSSPETIFEQKFRVDKSPVIWDEIFVGSASGSWNSTTVSYELSTTTAINDKAVFSSRRYIRYAPGKGLLLFLTGNLGADLTGITTMYGYYDDKDGYIFEKKDGVMSVTLRSYITGSAVDTSVTQANWNLDKLDGSGYSGKTLDSEKQQIFVIDLQWLGSGKVRLGFDLGGQIIYCHEFINANMLMTPYSTSADLPIRAEIFNHGTPSSNGKMDVTCMAALRDGPKDLAGSMATISSKTTEITLSTGFKHVASIRMKPDKNRFSIAPKAFEIIMTSGTKFIDYEILYNPSLTSPSWSSEGMITEYAIGTDVSSISGGTVVGRGHINVGGSTTVSDIESLLGAVYVGRAIDGTSDILSLHARTSGGSAKIVFNGAFEENL